jgi:hypothetical protein
MAQDLCIKVVGLEGRMMNVVLRPFKEEKAVVVDLFFPSVQSVEHGDVSSVREVNQLDTFKICWSV